MPDMIVHSSIRKGNLGHFIIGSFPFPISTFFTTRAGGKKKKKKEEKKKNSEMEKEGDCSQ